MAASSISDCYLCGARNDPEATYCVRCNGQLLKLPAENSDLEHVSIDHIVDDISEVVESDEAPQQKPRLKAHKGTLQEQRLSDALGLSSDHTAGNYEDETVDPNLVDTVVTSIPRATPSADIPLLGTRAGAVPQSAMHVREFGKPTFILLGLLLLATAWLGYSTLGGGNDDAPGSIAFTETSVPPSSTTTTERPQRVWQENEVEGKYSPTFVRITLETCTEDAREAASSVGVAVNNNSVVFDGSVLPNADLAWIRSRTGRSRLALIERRVDGTYVATSLVATSRNLGVTEVDDEPEFFLGYNPETNLVELGEDAEDEAAQIAVTATGAAHSITINGRTTTAQELLTIDTKIERIPGSVLTNRATTCERASVLREAEVVVETDDATEPEAE